MNLYLERLPYAHVMRAYESIVEDALYNDERQVQLNWRAEKIERVDKDGSAEVDHDLTNAFQQLLFKISEEVYSIDLDMREAFLDLLQERERRISLI
jgi:hypothetical protein